MFIKIPPLLCALVIPTFVYADGLCLPRAKPDAARWPVCAIYMHGLFGSPAYPEARWEARFRDSLEKIALAKGCRIAVPFGNRGRNRNWNGVSLREVERRAAGACDGSRLIDRPDIIGFSNGANVLRKAGCANLAEFFRVTLIGPTGVGGNAAVKRCGRVTIIQKHDVPALGVLSEAINFNGAGVAADDPR